MRFCFPSSKVGLLSRELSTAHSENSEIGLFFSFFLRALTLFVIDMHQIMLISLYPTPFDHFHFHPTFGLGPDLILTVCHKQNTWKGALLIKHCLRHNGFYNLS